MNYQTPKWIQEGATPHFQRLTEAAKQQIVNLLADVYAVELCRNRADSLDVELNGLRQRLSELQATLPKLQEAADKAEQAAAPVREKYRLIQQAKKARQNLDEANIPAHLADVDISAVDSVLLKMQRLNEASQNAAGRLYQQNYLIERLEDDISKGESIIAALRTRRQPPAPPSLLEWIQNNA